MNIQLWASRIANFGRLRQLICNMIKIYGIRHHGPGSSTSLIKALEEQDPDCVLIETPSDAEEMLRLIAESGNHKSDHKTLTPPVAILIYNPKNISQAVYLPFVEFSPEWQAAIYAGKRGIPIRCIDLPMEIQWAYQNSTDNREIPFSSSEESNPGEIALRKDPMSVVAGLAGFTDSERWWDVYFESAENETEIFNSIMELMWELRQSAPDDEETMMREHWMRQSILKAQKDGFDNIAVVCGAWHAPALQMDHQSTTEQTRLIKKVFGKGRRGAKKIKTTATWIPWSYERLNKQSGYGAGVVSPAWYELLFENRKEATLHWMVRVARLFREADFSASSVHTVNAIRLAEGLAALNQQSLPGISELRESAISTFCDGRPERFEFVENKLITGDKVGHVPYHLKIPAVPLQGDIDSLIKSARLTKYWESPGKFWLGETASNPKGGIDLREESGRLKSQLLHRLNLIDIPWGQTYDIDKHYTSGDFREFWELSWSPHFTILIIEAGALGNTLQAACLSKLNLQSTNAGLSVLATLLSQALKADLPEAVEPLISKLEDLSVLSTNVFELMALLPQLVRVRRYGDTRGTDLPSVTTLIEQMVPRICISLPPSLINLDETSSKEALADMMAVHEGIVLLHEAQFYSQWFQALQVVSGNERVNGILRGASVRLLFDRNQLSVAETSLHLRYSLSHGNAALTAAQWLEGFLQGSGLILLHHHKLWNLVDEWVKQLPEDGFREVLPVLRRAFSRFSPSERQKMLQQAGMAPSQAPIADDYDENRAIMVLPVVRRMMGIKEN